MVGFETLRAQAAQLALVVAVVFGLGACVSYSPGQGLPPGEYVSGDGQERITVGDSGSIRFQVRVEGRKSVEMTDREFNSHQIWAQSKTIRPQPMKNRDAVHGIGKYTWLWRDGKIAKTTKSGQVLTWFERRT
ncbi:MAG: hypothetical protein QNJ06_07715 [Kiloniellales bacterium]|nr:hypothetical protein [Kiloniellales bacterium]